MSISSSGRPPGEKRLERALNHVQDYWFPVNSELLKQIQSNLQSNQYEDRHAALVKDIRSDFSLFAYCLRELVGLIRQGEENIPLELSPLEMIEQANLQSLKTILEVPEQSISKHRISDGSDEQIDRFQELLVSSSAAEALAPSFDVDPDDAYSASVVRQLGISLIAWNYPGVYHEAIGNLSVNMTLDQAIAAELGFSPQLLAMRMLASWGIPEEQIAGFGLPHEEDDFAVIAPFVGQNLAELCQIGESLARANRPDKYPGARDDWEHARNQIEDRLGVNGMEVIRERLYENCERYLQYAPEVMSGGLILDPAHKFELQQETELHTQNPYFNTCSPKLRRSLKALYDLIGTASNVDKALKSFVKDVIPASLFSGGCVYTIDPGLMLLMPQLELGPTLLREIESIDYSVVISDSDLVSVAFQNTQPVIEYGKALDGDIMSGVAGIFGKSRRVGVLYLETPRSVFNDVNSQELIDFKALSFALTDCLKRHS